MESLVSYVDFSLKAKEGVVQREAVFELGDTFPIGILIQHAGNSDEPIVFDSISIEVIYNDTDEVIIQGDAHDMPVAGEMADNSNTTCCLYSGKPVRAGRLTDATPFIDGSPLLLEQRFNSEPLGPFKGRTGRAGLADKSKSFSLEVGADPVMLAAGKRNVGFFALGRDATSRVDSTPFSESVGSTKILAVGNAFRGSDIIPIIPAPSVVNVVSPRSKK